MTPYVLLWMTGMKRLKRLYQKERYQNQEATSIIPQRVILESMMRN